MVSKNEAVLLSLIFLLGITGGYLIYGFFPYVPQDVQSQKYCLNGTAELIISPGAETQILNAIGKAQMKMDILLFQFSNNKIKEALARSTEKGVKIRIILDPSVDQNLDTARFLKENGVEVKWSSKRFVYTHAKTAIIDGKYVLLGSINWSRNAMDNNREVDAFIENERMAQELEIVFEQDWNGAQEAK